MSSQARSQASVWVDVCLVDNRCLDELENIEIYFANLIQGVHVQTSTPVPTALLATPGWPSVAILYRGLSLFRLCFLKPEMCVWWQVSHARLHLTNLTRTIVKLTYILLFVIMSYVGHNSINYYLPIIHSGLE